MGVVYLSEDSGGHRVAIKLIRPELADDPAFRSRFRREVEAGRRVGGICTVKYLDADLDAERPYLVTEYVEGGNLGDYVADHGPLTGEQLVGLAVGLAEAIVAMHAAGVIHRDLKPTNVLMAASGPKVVDFGISHAVDGTALTQTGVVVGSPSWMAPEQAQGQMVTQAADVFSWGATVAFASAGRSPFGEGRPDAVIYRVVHEQPDLDGVDPKLMPMVAAALSKEPSSRPSSDRVLIETVKSAMSGDLPPGGSLAMTTLVLDRTWPQEPPEQARPSRRRQFALIAGSVVLIAAVVVGALYFAMGDQARNTPGHHHVAALRKPKNTTSTTTASAVTPTSPTTTTTSPSSGTSTASITADLPQVTCPTSYGVTPNPSPPPLPTSMQVAVPQNLADQLAVYSDQQGLMKLIGPQGWICSASIGADGSGSVFVHPLGQGNPQTESHPGPNDQYITGGQTSACVGCTEGQACPLFASAAADYERDYQMKCPPPPATQSVVSLSPGVVAYEIPAGTTGTGAPSPSNYTTHGVMTYYSGNENGSWSASCVLPDSQKSICTESLNRFVDWYGSN